MKFNQKSFLLDALVAGLMCCCFFSVHAASPDRSPVEYIAKVNGVEIPKSLFEAVLANNLAQGARDSDELRRVIKGELIAREVMAQESRKQKLDKEIAVKNQLSIQEQTVLAEVLLQKEMSTLKISDEQLKAEYERQTTLLADAEQFQVSHIVLATEAEAMQVLKATKSGESFQKLAQTKSRDPSGQNGGSLGWLLPTQLIAPISNVVVNMSVGQIAAAPIQTQQGWHVLRLEGKRKFQAPSFEETRPQLVQSIQATHRNEYVQNLLKAAKIQD